MLIARGALLGGALTLILGFIGSLLFVSAFNPQQPLVLATGLPINFIPQALTESPRATSVIFIGAITILCFLFTRAHTKTKTHIRSLEQSHRTLVHAQDIAALGNWCWDIKKRTLNCSHQVLRLLNGDLQILRGDDLPFFTSTHPADREPLSEAIINSLSSLEGFSIDQRICVAENQYLYVNLRAEVQINHSGKPVALFGIIQDISDRKITDQNVSEIGSLNLKLIG